MSCTEETADAVEAARNHRIPSSEQEIRNTYYIGKDGHTGLHRVRRDRPFDIAG